MNYIFISLCLLVGFLLPGCGPVREPATLTVYSAAGLTYPVSEISELFTAETGVPVEHCFTNAAVLRRKIEQAAGRADIGVFISANKYHMDALVDQGLVEGDTVKKILTSTLVVIVPVTCGSVPAVPSDLLALDLGPVAMGDPDARVPCGMYAREAFQSLNMWEAMKERTSREVTVCAVLARVEQGICRAGICFAAEAATSNKVKMAFTFPATSHSPITFLAGVVNGCKMADKARSYLEFLQTPPARKVFIRFGFNPYPPQIPPGQQSGVDLNGGVSGASHAKTDEIACQIFSIALLTGLVAISTADRPSHWAL